MKIEELTATSPEGEETSQGAYSDTLPVGILQVDRRYQRPINVAWVKKNLPLFDDQMLGVLFISRREDGSFYILDGQNRAELVHRALGPKAAVPVRVLTGLSYEDEARVFDVMNRERKGINPLIHFHARLEYKEPISVFIHETLAPLGLYVPKDNTPKGEGAIRAIGALDSIARHRDGDTLLKRVISVLHSAWGSSAAAYQGSLLKGLSSFLARYPIVDDRDLTRRLQKLGPDGPHVILTYANAPGMNSVTAASRVAAVFRDLYNQRRHSQNKLD